MKTWLITGVSSGIGRALAEEALAAGDTVVGTVRKDADLRAFEALHSERALGYLLDVTDSERVTTVVNAAEKRTGGLDVLVNNAGYGLIGAVEEFSMEELRAQFEVNFFGAFACIQAVLPLFREKRSGHVINITSVSGLAPWAGAAAYGSSKYALEGLGQNLALEMKEFGVWVTNVEPGAISTEFGKRSLATAKSEIAAYRDTAAHVPRTIFSEDQDLPGDARLAAKAIIEIVQSEEPPVHLLLGEDAVHYAEQQRETFKADMNKWMTVTRSICK